MIKRQSNILQSDVMADEKLLKALDDIAVLNEEIVELKSEHDKEVRKPISDVAK